MTQEHLYKALIEVFTEASNDEKDTKNLFSGYAYIMGMFTDGPEITFGMDGEVNLNKLAELLIERLKANNVL